MSGDSGEHFQIRPLTKVKKSGEKYFRRPEVEAQLPEAVRLTPEQLSASLKLPNKETSGYLYDETLVYLLREAHRRNDPAMVNLIYDQLSPRVEKLLRKHANQVDRDNSDDFLQDIHMRLIGKIFDLDSDKSDYAQINLGDFVTTLAGTDKRQHWRNEKKENKKVEIDAPNPDGHDYDPPDERLSPEEIALLNNSLGKLPEKTATAYLLHYRDGLQIESNDPDEPTVAKCFGVSGRTIRNWFSAGVKMLTAEDGGER